jgi:hypothetical protein
LPGTENWSTPAPLTAAHNLADFECGELTLDHWLKHRALRNAERTYVCVDI